MVKINGLPRDPGPAAWDALLPLRATGPKLEEIISTDWLVVGAGFAGLAAAYRLRKLHPTDRIVVLEARGISQGPIARNSGFMIDLPHLLSSSSYGGDLSKDRMKISANRAAIKFAKQAVEEYNIAPEAFDPMGKINGAMSPAASDLGATYGKHLSRLGEPFELLDAHDMQEITGSNAYHSGLFTPGTVILQPALYGRGMANGLTNQKVEIFENSPVTELTLSGGSWIARTPIGQVEAPRVILAVNGQIQRFGHFKRRLLHVYLYASMTRRLTPDECQTLGGHTKWGITPTDPMGSTVRRISGSGGDRIVIRNGITYDPNLTGSDRHLSRVAEPHRNGLAKRFPTLKNVPFEHSWGGALCLSRNDVPAFGEIDENLFSACCQNGLGSAHGTLSGMLIADLASGQTSLLLERHAGLSLPSRLSRLAHIGAPAVLKYKEWRARSEI